jgi:hypothetical protein
MSLRAGLSQFPGLCQGEFPSPFPVADYLLEKGEKKGF